MPLASSLTGRGSPGFLTRPCAILPIPIRSDPVAGHKTALDPGHFTF